MHAAADVSFVDALCPLCGTAILSISRAGHVEATELHPIALYRSGFHGQGFMLCDDCGTLAELSDNLSLN